MGGLYLMDEQNRIVAIYREGFPAARMTLFQIDYVGLHVTNEKVWQQVVTYWAANDYRPQSVFKMVEYYKELDKKDHFQNVPEDTNPDYSCGVCGKDICFELHRAA